MGTQYIPNRCPIKAQWSYWGNLSTNYSKKKKEIATENTENPDKRKTFTRLNSN